VKCFMKSCMSSAVDESGDVMLWNGIEEDKYVRSKCEEDEGTDYEDGASDTNL